MKNVNLGWITPLVIVALVAWGGHARSDPPPFQPEPIDKVHVEMFIGDDVIVVQSGPLELHATCSQSGLSKILSLFVTSSLDGWFVASSGTALLAGDIHTYLSIARETNPFWQDVNTPPAISSSGDFLAINAGLGVNLLGNDCILVGRFTAIQRS